MQKTVIGNWKMHGTLESAALLASEISDYVSVSGLRNTKVVLCPPALHFSKVLENIAGSAVALGAQDCSDQAQGAYTGDLSVAMLSDAGAEYVIVGHSERRSGYDESDALIADKARMAKEAGLLPVICIGESLAQRESGEYADVLARQAQHSVPQEFKANEFLLAYEPVWAIGTGKVADSETIHVTHEHISKQLPSGAAILYGGSVKPENAEEIMTVPYVDGVLVGGASLKSNSFNAIIAAAEREEN